MESYLLKQILSLPFGPEIYLLLLRWNPLRLTCEMPLSKNDHHVAVMGLGPAGLAMGYYLLMRGISVHGFDALNLEAPEYDVTIPVKTLTEIKDVAPRAFGGVMAYGITVRWDKLLLNLIWVGLKRFKHLSIQGDVRLGGTVTISKLIDWGFSHVVLATGAGLPKSLLIDGAYNPVSYTHLTLPTILLV